ncbi:MAG: metal ABC transporter substrate-binding protein [Candidatus Omnitrophica bacterium]|nr:metal ABC transporter substrate-binding protein [Candidatus Omnitrophota bacterium]
MKIRRKIISFFTALCLFTSFCSILDAKAAEIKGIKVVTSFYPVYILAKNVARDVPGVLVQNFTPPMTGCLHDYTVSTNDMRKLADAQVFVANGAGAESFLDKIVNGYPNLKIVDLSKDIPLIKGLSGEYNSHVWVSISNSISQAKILGKALGEFDPAHKELYDKNTIEYVAKLEVLREKMHSELAEFKARAIITFHEAFPYFSEEFGFNIIAVVEREPGSEPSAKELADTIEIVRKHNVVPLFVEPQYPASVAKTIAKETKASIYILDPVVIGPDDYDAYLDIMENNLKILKQALR